MVGSGAGRWWVWSNGTEMAGGGGGDLTSRLQYLMVDFLGPLENGN